MAADLTKSLAIIAAVAACLTAAGCADLAYDPTTAPMPVFADASSSSHDMFAPPDVLPADKVFKDGQTTGKYNGQDYVCGTPDCSVTVKANSSPPPHAQDAPGASRH